jgi:hypothetical protein
MGELTDMHDDKKPTIDDVNAWRREKDQKTAEWARARYNLIRDAQGPEAADRDLQQRLDQVLLDAGVTPRLDEKIAKAKRDLDAMLKKPGGRLA